MGALVCALDIGNSVTHAGLVDCDSLTCKENASCATGDIENALGNLLTALRRRERGRRAMALCISCVAPSVRAAVADILQGMDGFDQPVWVGYKDNLPVAIHYDNRESLGADRIANLLYAKAVQKNDPVAIIDAGTAITFDCLGSGGEFAGGAIVPGPSLQLSSMSANAEQLPETAGISASAHFPGGSTEACMQAGVWYGIAGALEKLLHTCEKSAGSVTVYASGGAWEPIAPLVSFKHTYVESLTLIGTALFDSHK
jgi:type III pantothenate kinase